MQLYCLEAYRFSLILFNFKNSKSTFSTQRIIPAVVQKNCAGTVRCGFRDRETFGGENTTLNKVLFLICLSLQEALRALCCKVSASCLPLFLAYSFSSPFLSPFFPPPAVWPIEFIPHGRTTTSGGPPQPPQPPQPLPTHVTLPARLPCCTSGSCESQCCSLIQGKRQTQEMVFKYLHIQRFFFLWTATFIIADRPTSCSLMQLYANTGTVCLQGSCNVP